MKMPGRQPAALWVLLGLLLFSVAGCRKKQVQAAPLPPPVETRSAPDPMLPPAVSEGAAPLPSPELVIPPPRPAPRPPRRTSSQPATPEPAPETAEAKPAPPRIAPRLTPAEEDTYRERTWQAILTTEKNLQDVGGRPLSISQQDIEGKVRGFLAQAREAIGVGDWVRALNLAEKALVLSRELIPAR